MTNKELMEQMADETKKGDINQRSDRSGKSIDVRYKMQVP